MQTRANAAPILRPEDVLALLIRPMLAASVAGNVATYIGTASSQFRVPMMTATPSAQWVAEGAEIPPSDATFADLTITPSKLAGLTIVTNELANDSSPAAVDALGNGLAIDLARKLDVAFFGAKGADAARPAGLLDLTGFTPVAVGAALANADPFIDAIAASEAAYGRVTAFVANPADVVKLAKLKQATGSQVPLLQLDPSGSGRRVIQGVQLYSTPAVAAGVIWGIPQSSAYLVVRQDATIDVDESVFFTSDRVAVRAKTRVGFGFANPAAVVKVTFTP